MSKMQEQKLIDLIEMLKDLKECCKNEDDCDTCRFNYGYGLEICRIEEVTKRLCDAPAGWDFKRLEKWVKRDD